MVSSVRIRPGVGAAVLDLGRAGTRTPVRNHAQKPAAQRVTARPRPVQTAVRPPAQTQRRSPASYAAPNANQRAGAQAGTVQRTAWRNNLAQAPLNSAQARQAQSARLAMPGTNAYVRQNQSAKNTYSAKSVAASPSLSYTPRVSRARGVMAEGVRQYGNLNVRRTVYGGGRLAPAGAGGRVSGGTVAEEWRRRVALERERKQSEIEQARRQMELEKARRQQELVRRKQEKLELERQRQRLKAAKAAAKAAREVKIIDVKVPSKPFPFQVIFIAAIATCLFMFMLYTIVQISTYTSNINSMNSRLVTLKQQQANLNVQIDQKVDLNTVQDVAVNQLGMVKEDLLPHQYISIDSPDQVTFTPDTGTGTLSSLLDTIRSTFAGKGSADTSGSDMASGS